MNHAFWREKGEFENKPSDSWRYGQDPPPFDQREELFDCILQDTGERDKTIYNHPWRYGQGPPGLWQPLL